MKINEILKETKLQYQDSGFGLSQYGGDGYTLVGGYRSGSSPSNLTRVRYDIVDHALYNETNDLKQSKLGFVELFVDHSNKIIGLVNIEISGKGQGTGRKVVKDLS